MNPDLQPLPDTTLASIREYFSSKKELLEKQDAVGTIFASKAKKAKIVDEIENAKRTLRDLYEKRERKVISQAIFTVRTDSKLKDNTNMLPAEEELYGEMIELLKGTRRRFMSTFRAKPKKEEEAPKEEPQREQKAEGVVLKFVEEVPQLVDSDLKEYGPFAINEVASLPEQLAILVVKQGKAVRIEP